MTTRFSFWTNDRKSDPKHPDGRGQIEITTALVQELAAAMATGQGITTNYKGEPVFRLRAAAWRGNGQPRQPVFSGTVESLASTQEQDAKLAQWRAQQAQQNGNGAAAAWGAPQQPAPPQQPQQPAPQPQVQQPPAAPAPVPQAAPQQPFGAGFGAPAPNPGF